MVLLRWPEVAELIWVTQDELDALPASPSPTEQHGPTTERAPKKTLCHRKANLCSLPV